MGIAMVINGKEIYEEELYEEWNKIKKVVPESSLFLLDNNQEIEGSTLKLAKENIIARVLIEQEAEKVIEEIDFKSIKEEYERIKRSYGGNEAFLEELGKNQTNEFIVKEGIEKSLKVDELVKNWMDLTVNNYRKEEEMIDFYEVNKRSLYSCKRRLLLSHIFLGKEANNEKIMRKNMEDLLVDFNEKTKFKDLSKKAKAIKGIEIKTRVLIEEGSFAKEVEELLFSIENNSISKLIETQDGFHIFQKVKEFPFGIWEYKYIKDKVEEDFKVALKKQTLKSKINGLKSKAIIKDFFKLNN